MYWHVFAYMCWNKYIIHIFGAQKHAQSRVKKGLACVICYQPSSGLPPVPPGGWRECNILTSAWSVLAPRGHQTNISCRPSPQISSPVQDTSRVELMSMRQWHIVRGCQAQPPWFRYRYLQIFLQSWVTFTGEAHGEDLNKLNIRVSAEIESVSPQIYAWEVALQGNPGDCKILNYIHYLLNISHKIQRIDANSIFIYI